MPPLGDTDESATTGRAGSGKRRRRTRCAEVAGATVMIAGTLGAVGLSAGSPRFAAGLGRESVAVPAQHCRVGTAARPSRRALVLYDSQGEYAAYGQQSGVLAANFVSHFARPVARPVRSYRPGEMRGYAAVVYVGTQYGERLPRAFLADVRAGLRPVLWLGENAWQLTTGAFARRGGWVQRSDRSARYRSVTYRGVRLSTTAKDLAGIVVRDPRKATVLGTARASRGAATPWAVRSGRLTYVAEAPLDSNGQQDRSFAVADLLATTFGQPAVRHRALLRLEDVGPNADPRQLRAVADVLAARHVPFAVAVYPVYIGPLGTRPRVHLRLRDTPEVVRALRYLLARGGTLVLHGYTHQLGDLRNPTNGESAQDYEFYRTHFDPRGTLVYDGPVPGDSLQWARSRMTQAVAQIQAAGLPRPVLWEFPHYGASPADYRAAAGLFLARFDRGSYAAGRVGHEDDRTLTEQTPPYLVRDSYGSPVLPETLGHLSGPHVPAAGRGSVPAVLADAAVQRAAVRDNVAGVFVHPFLGAGPVREVADGLHRLGYVFSSPCSVLAG